MRNCLILAILFLPLRAYCQSDKEQTQQLLLGNWKWINTEIVDRGGGRKETPLSCNCARNIFFKKDTVYEYYNDSLEWNLDYYLDEHNFLNDPVQIIIHSKFLTGQIVLKNDTLGIGPFGGCGVLQYFVKDNKQSH